MKDENIKTIFIDKNDDTKKAETLVKRNWSNYIQIRLWNDRKREQTIIYRYNEL